MMESLRRMGERLYFARFCILHRRSLAAQRRWQEKRLRRLVQYAYKNVPLWRELLDDRRVNPDSIYTFEDMRKLPVSEKQTFIGRMVEEYIDSSRTTDSRWYLTSGTSGTPLQFLMSERAVQKKYIAFATLRFLWWRGVSTGELSSINHVHIKIRGISDEHHLFIPVKDFLGNPRQTLTQIVRFRAEIISAYPSILLEMARLISEDPTLPKPTPRFIISIGEMLTPSVRTFVEDVLKAEIYDRYGLEEIGAIGVECVRHDGFHINTESVIVEITDDSYATISPGVEGRIVATDLLNYGMPFIRYDTGDRGKISNEPCACGLRSPRLWIEGRYSASLSFPARRIHHLEFDGAMDGFMNNIFQYQIAKISDSAIMARIIPGPAFYVGVSEKVKESLGKLVGEDVNVSVELVEELPLTPRGKSKIVIDESSSADSR